YAAASRQLHRTADERSGFAARVTRQAGAGCDFSRRGLGRYEIVMGRTRKSHAAMEKWTSLLCEVGGGSGRDQPGRVGCRSAGRSERPAGRANAKEVRTWMRNRPGCELQ